MEEVLHLGVTKNHPDLSKGELQLNLIELCTCGGSLATIDKNRICTYVHHNG